MDEDIYIVDTRNADHRTQHGGTPWRPGQPVRTVTAQPTRVYGPSPYMQAQPQIIYANPPQGAFGQNLFGKITGGQLVDMVAQIFAALMPLPGAPVATDSAATDVGNLILFQGALAQHAKRDEQVRTLGGLVAKLVG